MSESLYIQYIFLYSELVSPPESGPTKTYCSFCVLHLMSQVGTPPLLSLANSQTPWYSQWPSPVTLHLTGPPHHIHFHQHLSRRGHSPISLGMEDVGQANNKHTTCPTGGQKEREGETESERGREYWVNSLWPL